MTEKLKKPFLKKSPCRIGCMNLDVDDNSHYCSVVTDMDKFDQSCFGTDFGEFPRLPLKKRRYRNCNSKVYK